MPGVAAVCPRRTWLRSTPTRASATRWPAVGALDRRGRAPARCAPAPRGRRGSIASRSPTATVPDHSVPVTTVPMPAQRERRGRSAAAPARRRGPRCGAAPRARRAPSRSVVEPGAGARRHLDDLRAGVGRRREQLVDVPAAPARPARRRRGRASSAPRRRAGTPSSSRIARCSRVCGITPSSAATHEQEQVDPGRAGHHRAHEPLVARARRRPTARRPDGELERRVAELDRDAARLLLRQPVGVDAGQRARRAPSCRGRCGRRCRASEA